MRIDHRGGGGGWGIRAEPLLLPVQRSQMTWLWRLMRMPPGRPSGELLRTRPPRAEAPGKTQDTLGAGGEGEGEGDYREHLSIPQDPPHQPDSG